MIIKWNKIMIKWFVKIKLNLMKITWYKFVILTPSIHPSNYSFPFLGPGLRFLIILWGGELGVNIKMYYFLIRREKKMYVRLINIFFHSNIYQMCRFSFLWKFCWFQNENKMSFYFPFHQVFSHKYHDFITIL